MKPNTSGFYAAPQKVVTPEWVNRPFVDPFSIIGNQRLIVLDSGKRRRAGADSDDDEGDDRDDMMNELPEDEQQPPVVEEKEYFIPHPLKSRKLELEKLGPPGCRSGCFGCVYFGENDTTLLAEDIKRLEQMAKQSFGRIDLIALAEEMANYYEKVIRKNVAETLQDGEKPLQPWPASQILEHLRHHNQDPLVQQVVLLAETQELRATVLDCCLEVSSKTGQIRPNKHNIDCYEKLTKLQLHIQKQDSSKMAFHSAGGRINPEILSQGVLSTQTKRLHNSWRTKK